MRKALALFFLIVYLLSATEVGQLLKIPAFVTHLSEHQQENEDITLWQFIVIHYASGDVRDADYDKDMKLPFKTQNQSGFQISITTPPQAIIFTPLNTAAFPSHKVYYAPDAGHTASFHSLIWQPPKA